MERSRRTGPKARPCKETTTQAPSVPASSRLTVKNRRNRRRPQSLWARMPGRREIVDACGRALRRALPGIAVTAAILAVGTTLWLGYRFVTTSERFAIAAIEVHGTSQLAEDELRAALPVKVGANIFKADLDDVTRSLRAHPWIASATAHRVLPETIVVEITEHVAAAVVQLGELGELYLVDQAGHPFARAQLDALDGASLPIVTGLDRDRYHRDPDGTARAVTDALAVLARWRTEPSRPAVGEVHLDAHGSLTLHTIEHGTAIELGMPGRAGARMKLFDAVWTELTETERERTKTLHLDGRPDHVTVAFAKD